MLRLTLAATFTLFVAVGLLSAIEGRPPGELARGAGLEADPAAPGAAVEVTRAAGFSAIAPAQSHAPAPAPAPSPVAEPDPAPAPEAAPEPEMAAMTAGIVADLSRATGAAEPEPDPEPARAPAPVSRELDALTQAVLTSLGAPTTPASEAAPGRDLSSLISQAMQAGEGDAYVAALLDEATGGAAPEAAEPAPRDLSSLIDAALAHEGSDAYIDALLNEAASAGRIEVPAALRTADGRFDTRTLINDLVQKSAGAPAPVRAPTLENSGGVEGVEVRVVQQVDAARDALFYTVQEGDSLGAIAQRFYGNASLYLQIFEANRQTLSSPDRIRIGQRLRLPDVSA